MSLKNSFQPKCITNQYFLYFFFKGEQMTPLLSDVDLAEADEIFKKLFSNVSQQGKHFKKLLKSTNTNLQCKIFYLTNFKL